MSDTQALGFGPFIPGFDFLQQLAQAGQGAGVPPLSHWVAPTLNVEEIDKRIEDLKAVRFWLEHNSRALEATVQALQVQKMTLSTLQQMNIQVADWAQVFSMAQAMGVPAAKPAPGTASASPLSQWPLSGDKKHPAAASENRVPPVSPSPTAAPAAAPAVPDSASSAAQALPLQWWSALTQQFQQIATQALQDPAQQAALVQASSMASDLAKTMVHTADQFMRQAVAGASVPESTAAAPAVTQPPAGKVRSSAPKAAPAPRARKAPRATPAPAATSVPARAARPAAAGRAKTGRSR